MYRKKSIFTRQIYDTIRYIDIEPMYRYGRYLEASLLRIGHSMIVEVRGIKNMSDIVITCYP